MFYIFYFRVEKCVLLIESLRLVFDSKSELRIAEVCNSFYFCYNKDRKRAELELDSNVAR